MGREKDRQTTDRQRQIDTKRDRETERETETETKTDRQRGEEGGRLKWRDAKRESEM